MNDLELPSNKITKIVVLGLFLAGASYYWGWVLRQVESFYQIITIVDYNYLSLVIHLLVALTLLFLAISLIAGLVRPLKFAVLICILAAICLVWGWQNTENMGIIMGILFFVLNIIYVAAVDLDLRTRLKFTTLPIREKRNIINIFVVILVCSALYMGANQFLSQNGEMISEKYLIMLTEYTEQEINKNLEAQDIPEAQKTVLVENARSQMEENLGQSYEQNIKPYEVYIPYFLILIVFTPLLIWIKIYSIIINIIFELLFAILRALQIVRVRKEMKEAEVLEI